MSDCILWGGRVSRKGYARAYRDGRDVEMHRYAYIQTHGPVPKGVSLHHICGVKHCVNPEHLVTVTPREHMLLHRSWEREHEKRRARTHCKRGHEFTEANTYHHSGRRHCRACHRERSLDYWRRSRDVLGAG